MSEQSETLTQSYLLVNVPDSFITRNDNCAMMPIEKLCWFEDDYYNKVKLTAPADTCEGGICEQRSVMAGGGVRGWLPDVAVVLWKRVLGLLGDPCSATPVVHAHLMQHLTDLTATLLKVTSPTHCSR